MMTKTTWRIGFLAAITALAVLGCSRTDDAGKGITSPGPEPGVNLYGGGVGGLDDIDDLYYLRAIGNPAHDYGTLQKAMPTRPERTACDRFIVFDYGMPGPGGGTFTLSNIYYHVWFNGYLGQERLDAAYNVGDDHGNTVLDGKHPISTVGGYKLTSTLQTVDPPLAIAGDDILDLSLVFTGLFPDVIANPNQYSFVILSLPDAATLATLDTDSDALNDYVELFAAYTNPYDGDTDNDGVGDAAELAAVTDPNDFNDF